MHQLWASAACSAGCSGAAYAFAFGAAPALLGGRRAARGDGGVWRRCQQGCRLAGRSGSGGLCRALSGSVDAQVEDKRRSLLRFVQEVQPHDALEAFQQSAPQPVADAMRTTVTNLLGALPPDFFEMKVTATVEDLAGLVFSLMVTGYMYRNAQYRMDLDFVRCSYDDQEGVAYDGEEQTALTATRAAAPVYAEGTQLTRVAGSVLRWRKDTEQLEEVDARQYIQQCESEIASLREQLSRSLYARGTGNELLDFLKCQEPAQVNELTKLADGVMEAMNSFVQRLLGNEIRQVESTASELARVLYWAMVTGYNLRQLEVKCDFEASFTVQTLPAPE